MPEGDSVYRLRERLDAATRGARVVDGELRSGNAAGRSLAGRTIVAYDTHGKHLLTRFDHAGQALTLHTHLRMDGEWSIVGAGTVVTGTVPENATAVGVPARVVKRRPAGWHDLP